MKCGGESEKMLNHRGGEIGEGGVFIGAKVLLL